MSNSIHQVSDTAIWVATYRAQESKREDAVFNDKLAEKLAGNKGKEIVSSIPFAESMAFAIVARTTAIDRLILKTISLGIDTVINLGAGLDTRPYRMQLPGDLKWIEVDFKHMIDYKNTVLVNEKPVCNLKRIAFDLSDRPKRKELFKQLGKDTKKALVITEGVIAYLENEDAAKLSEDIYSVPTFNYWIQDYAQGKFRRNKQSKEVEKKLDEAPWKFTIEKPIEFFMNQGWKPLENIFILDEGDRIGRKLPPMPFPYSILFKLFPKTLRNIGNKTYGYMLFQK